MSVEQLIAEAQNNPECFKCREPIKEFSEVRVVTVRVNDEARDVWVHAAHAAPGRPIIGTQAKD